MTITDEMLRDAAAEFSTALAHSLPSPEDCTHTFSPRFRRKMRPILHRRRSIRHPVLQRTAAAVLAAILGVSVWLGIDANARAAFISWLRIQRDNAFIYQFAGPPPQETLPLYLPTWLPEGFDETDRQITSWNAYIDHTDPDDNYFTLEYVGMQDGTSAGIILPPDRETERQPVTVNGWPGELYLSFDPDKGKNDNTLFWFDDRAHMCFTLASTLDPETMLRIAESVAPADPPK